ncbi:MAG TPA: hypothetical protein VH482_34885 [Thermomicrobiales bacterium]|jgi:hypothetical protein
MNARHGTALVARGRGIVITREGDIPPPPFAASDEGETCWTDSALAVFALVTDPLSILGFPVRLPREMAISQQSD